MTSRSFLLPFFVAVVVLSGMVIGLLTAPGAWYAGLLKPPFNPPNWLFGPVWTVLYVMIGVVGWRVWTKTSDGGLRALWLGQMALNFLWSPAFFTAQNPALALVVIAALLASLVAFMLRARSHDPLSIVLFVPYLAWVSFATVLNASIWWLN